ncbi:MAG: metallopeptidase family protein [Microlunatus sp.]|nr:metallopeptidase family protein [Microlunatus sp.]
MVEMPVDQFEAAVVAALDGIPEELSRLMDNVAVFVADEPAPGSPNLFGLYEGIPLTERGEWYSGALPDRITIYRGPTLRACATVDQVIEQISVTVVHEVAHHFGISDRRLGELGWA